jgi:CBS domain containing-hemolysin-like protein
MLGEVFTLSDTARHVIAFTIALSIVVFLHMVVGEMAPKSWAIAHPEKSSLRVARPFRLFVQVFRPIIRLLNGLANTVVRAVGVEPQDERAMAHSPSDLLLLIEESAGHGGIAAREHELLARSLELSGSTAADAMTPRRDIVAVAADATAAEVATEAHRTGRTRVVVHEGDLDHVRGFVHAKDVIRLEHGTWPTTSAGSLARPIMVTPEHHGLEDLLLEMRTQRHHISLVVDEHGLVLGLVTLEDVIEELIGDFDDESDRRLGDCEQLADGSFRMNGTTRVEHFEECTGVALPDGDWQTVAGYVIDALDEIPTPGKAVHTDVGVFEVLTMDGYAIDALRVKVIRSQP